MTEKTCFTFDFEHYFSELVRNGEYDPVIMPSDHSFMLTIHYVLEMSLKCRQSDIENQAPLPIMMKKNHSKELVINQPDLGITITELRTQKGFTQEKLAEYCEVSKRTIQRIESGEVEPRAFTLNNLSNILEFDFVNENTQNETTWLALLHLSSCLIFTFILVPLLIWSGKKKQSHKIDQHGRAVLNFQVTVLLLLFVAIFFLMIIIGGIMVMDETHVQVSDLAITAATFSTTLPFFVLGIFSAFQGIINALRTLSDKPIHYRLSIPFVK